MFYCINKNVFSVCLGQMIDLVLVVDTSASISSIDFGKVWDDQMLMMCITQTNAYVHKRARANTHVQPNTYTHTQAHTWTYTYTRTHMHARTRACVHACTHLDNYLEITALQALKSLCVLCIIYLNK